MFRKHGIAGIFLIIFSEIAVLSRIEPLVYWFTPLVWIGYILVVDSIVYQLRRYSLIVNRKKLFISLFILSEFFWIVFEIYNVFLGGWFYENIPGGWMFLPGHLAFATILPAIMETFDLIRALRFFEKTEVDKIKIKRKWLYLSIIIGISFLIVPFFVKSVYAFAMVWTGFVFLLDPINYIFHEKSLIAELRRGKLNVPLSLFAAGLICGFFWEFWNYWAVSKWTYFEPPFLKDVKIFEMPVIGFIAFGPFAWELYAMLYFVKLLYPEGLFGKKRKKRR